MSEEKMQLEITSDPGDNRYILQEIIKQLRGPNGRGASREISLAITKLEEARFWLGEAMFGQGSQLTPDAADKPRKRGP
jgi:hypothetical protein